MSNPQRPIIDRTGTVHYEVQGTVPTHQRVHLPRLQPRAATQALLLDALTGMEKPSLAWRSEEVDDQHQRLTCAVIFPQADPGEHSYTNTAHHAPGEYEQMTRLTSSHSGDHASPERVWLCPSGMFRPEFADDWLMTPTTTVLGTVWWFSCIAPRFLITHISVLPGTPSDPPPWEGEGSADRWQHRMWLRDHLYGGTLIADRNSDQASVTQRVAVLTLTRPSRPTACSSYSWHVAGTHTITVLPASDNRYPPTDLSQSLTVTSWVARHGHPTTLSPVVILCDGQSWRQHLPVLHGLDDCWLVTIDSPDVDQRWHCAGLPTGLTDTILDSVLPMIRDISNGPVCLVGQSLTGATVLWAWLGSDGAVNHCIALSPSLWRIPMMQTFRDALAPLNTARCSSTASAVASANDEGFGPQGRPTLCTTLSSPLAHDDSCHQRNLYVAWGQWEDATPVMVSHTLGMVHEVKHSSYWPKTKEFTDQRGHHVSVTLEHYCGGHDWYAWRFLLPQLLQRAFEVGDCRVPRHSASGVVKGR